MSRWLVLVLLCGCGRIGFDPGADPNPDANPDASCLCQDLTTVLDDFNRADGALGSPWSGDLALYSINGGVVGKSGTGTIWWSAETSAVETAFVTVVNSGLDEEAGVAVGAPSPTSGTDYVFASLHSNATDPHFDYGSFVGGNFVSGASISHAAFAGSHRLQIVLEGANEEVIFDGVSLGTFALTWPHVDQPGYIGMYSYYPGAASRYDNFGGGACCAP